MLVNRAQRMPYAYDCYGYKKKTPNA